MAQLFSNNASTTLAAGINDIVTTINVVDGSKFQSPGGFDYELLTIADNTSWEVVKVTSRSTNTLTVARGFEGTAQAWPSGTKIEGRITKSTLDNFRLSPGTSGTKSVEVGDTTASANYSTSIGQYSVASGVNSIAMGYGATSTNNSSISIGYGADATADWSMAIGVNSAANNAGGISIGDTATSTATHAIAIGTSASNRIGDSSVITGMSLVRKDNGENANDEHLFFTGSQAIVFSKEIDLKTLADNVSTITIPTGATFYPDEVGLVITSADGVTGQPDVSFGITGNTTAVLASTPATKSAAKGRDIYTPAKDGVNSLTASVKTAATGTTLMGRFYWKGILVEDE